MLLYLFMKLLVFAVGKETMYSPDSPSQYSDYDCVGDSLASRSCIFHNVCYAAKNKSWLFYREESSTGLGVTSLPTSTFVDANSNVFFEHHRFFPSDWRIALETSYVHHKSQYESQPGFYSFAPPTVINSAIPTRTKAGGTGTSSSSEINASSSTIVGDHGIGIDSDIVVEWESLPYMLMSRTRMDDNAGHVVFEQYHPLLTAIDSHIGMQNAKSVTTVDFIWNQHSASRYHGMYDKRWKLDIGSVLFKKQIHQRDFKQLVNTKAAAGVMLCFRNLIVGCGRLSGLEGQLHHRHDSIVYMRDKLWERYVTADATNKSDVTASIGDAVAAAATASAAGSTLTTTTTTTAAAGAIEIIPGTGRASGVGADLKTGKSYKGNKSAAAPLVRVLMLQKNASSWFHTNFITNWAQLVEGVAGLHGVLTVTHLIPYLTPFKQQVQAYALADVVISLWGGISMLNFLMPPGGVQLVITSWYKDIMPFPNSTAPIRSSSVNTLGSRDASKNPKNNKDILKCPDFDDLARDNWGLGLKTLRYCTRDEGYETNTIDVPNFLKVASTAVEYMQWKKTPQKST